MYYIIRNVGLRISYLTWLNYLASELPTCFMKYEEKKIEIENPKDLLSEIAYINGFLKALNKSIPEMPELNKILKQIK